MNNPATPMNTHPAKAPADPAVLPGDGRYGFTVRVEGDDLVARAVRATWFGGAHDPQDNGQTASGVSTRLHPDLLGCALPMNGFRVTRGSPLPDLPWLSTTVEVTRPANGRRVSTPLIDLGPAAPPHAHAAIDLTLAAFRALGGDPAVGSLTVDFRVLGGARHLPANILSAARAAQDAKQPSAPPPAIPATRPPRENGPGPAPTTPALPANVAAAAVARGTAPAVAAASGGAVTGLAGPAAPPARGE